MRKLRPGCSHCVYWQVDLSSNPATVGHCHRYPPRVLMNPQTGHVMQKFPTTDQRHWCGEWSDDEKRLGDAAKKTAVGTVARAKPESLQAGNPA
jgi:hypothetical protein